MSPSLSLPSSPIGQFMGWKLLSHEPRGYVRIAFEPRPEFLNPAGYVQGGFLTAMLDDCTGPAVWFATNAQLYTVTIDLNVNFLAPVALGPLTGEGEVVRLGKTVGFVDARLLDAQGQLLVRASSTVRLIATERALPSKQ